MRGFWNYVDRKNWLARTKYVVAIIVICTLFAAVGLGLWFIIKDYALSTIDWMICFICYPIVISYIGVFIYGCNHEFHDGHYN
ncbi:MAG: hypothetical protein K6F66_03810 [Pseudobutyrivibrio sp.]|nr:hypothetical protein [Pseudobutyrivibrio sp.]